MPDLSRFGREPDPAAQRKIPPEWTSVDRVLDVQFRGKNDGEILASHEVKFRAPPASAPHIDRIVACYFKWKTLPYGDGALRPRPLLS